MVDTKLTETEKYNNLLKERARKLVEQNPPQPYTGNITEVIKSPVTGEYYNKPVQDVDYNTDIVMGYNTEYPSLKYKGVVPELKTAGESAANLLTLGAFEHLRKPYLSPEERQEILERQKYTKLGDLVGQTAAFFAPWSKIGTVGKALGAVPRAGTMAAEAIGSGARLQQVAALTAQGAIDAGAATFAAANAHNALDDYHKENLLSETVKGMLFGGTLGALIGGIARPTPVIKALGEPKAINFPKLSQDLIDSANKSERGTRNIEAWSGYLDDTLKLFTKEDGLPIDASSLSLADLQKRDFRFNYLDSLMNNPKEIEDYFVTHLKDFKSDTEAVIRAHEAGLRYGTEGRPIQKVLDDMHSAVVEGGQKDLITLRRMRGAKEAEFKPETLDTSYPTADTYKLGSDSVIGSNSFFSKTIRDLDDRISNAGISADAEQYLKSLHPNYLQDLQTNLKAAAERAGLISQRELIRSKAAKQAPTVATAKPSQIYKFIEESDKLIGETFANAKDAKLRAGLRYNNEAELYSNLKKELSDLRAQFDGFAPNQDKITRIIARLNEQDEALRTVFEAGKLQKKKVVKGGKFAEDQSLERGLIPRTAFDKYKAYNSSTGKSSLAEVRPTVEQYFDVLDSGFKDYQKLTGTDMSAFLERNTRNKEAAIRAMDDRDIISKQSLERWYKWQKKIAGGEGKITGAGLQSLTVRFNRMIHDLTVGNTGAASRQVIGAISDTILGKMKANKTSGALDEAIQQQFHTLAKIKEAGDRGQQIQQSFVSNLFSSAKKYALKPAAQAVKRSLPYTAQVMSRDNYDKINDDYRKINQKIFEFTSDPSVIFNNMEKNRIFNKVNFGAGDELNEKTLGMLSLLKTAMPQDPSDLSGGGPPSIIERCKYLDYATALTNPYRVIEMMQSGTVTPEMVTLCTQAYPAIFNSLEEKVKNELRKNPLTDIKTRTKIKSLFPGIDSVVRPIPGAEPVSMPPMSAPEHPGDHIAPAMPKMPNLKDWDANKKYGTFTTLGKP